MRFHVGFSFRWKTIKKFLFPFLVGLLAYFGFNGIFDNFNLGFIKVFADTNMSTKYNVTMYDYKTYMVNKTCGNTNMYDYINSIISSYNWENTRYQIFIGGEFNRYGVLDHVNMYFIQNSYISQSQGHKIWVYGKYDANAGLPEWKNSLIAQASKNTYPVGYLEFYFNNCLESDLPQFTTYIDNILNNGNYNSSFNPKISVINNHTGSVYYDVDFPSPTLSNNSNITVDGGWWYYSSYKLYMANSSEASGTNKYWKTIHIEDNDTNYGYDAQLPSYYDIYPPTNPSFLGYKTQLDTFYTNLSPSNVSNYSLKIKFRVPQSLLGYYQTPQEYVDNTTFDFACGGRVDHTNYFSYETFPCTLTSSYVLTSNTIQYTFTNINTSQSLSNYDKIYVTIKSSYLDSNISTTMFDFSYIYNYGSFYNTSYKGTIFENFDLLPIDFSMYFSSNNPQSQSKLYVDTSYLTSDIYTLGFSNTSHDESYAVGQSILGSIQSGNEYENLLNFKLTHVSNNYDTGIMIFQQNGTRRLEHLYLFFNGGMYISNNINNNEYYYIDNTGTITTGTFSQPIINGNNDSYDISYYTSYVSNFIDGLSASSLILSTYTQDFYNGLPIYFQTFLFVMFILGCIYIIYNLIRK